MEDELLKRKMNIFMKIGLILYALTGLSRHIELLPDFMNEFCVGFGFAFLLLGIVVSRADMSKIRERKMKFIQNTFSSKNS